MTKTKLLILLFLNTSLKAGGFFSKDNDTRQKTEFEYGREGIRVRERNLKN